MERQLTAVLLISALLLTMTACNASGAARTLDAAEDRVEEKLDSVEDTVERAIRKAAIPSLPAPVSTEAAPSSVTQAASDPLTKEAAEQIALDYLGLARDQVKRLHTEYEIDDGIGQYDVQFISGDWEYEFEIHAETGKIISFDKDYKYD